MYAREHVAGRKTINHPVDFADLSGTTESDRPCSGIKKASKAHPRGENMRAGNMASFAKLVLSRKKMCAASTQKNPRSTWYSGPKKKRGEKTATFKSRSLLERPIFHWKFNKIGWLGGKLLKNIGALYSHWRPIEVNRVNVCYKRKATSACADLLALALYEDRFTLNTAFLGKKKC